MSKRPPESRSGPGSKSRRAVAEEAPRANRSRAVAELLPSIGGAAFRRFGFVQSSIVSRWSEIVGERYAAASSPESIRFPMGQKTDGVLTLVVRSAFAPMMQHIQPEIVERVNRFFGYHAVARIVIRHGEVARPAAKRAPAPTKVVPVELGQSLKTIADPELKAVLEALAGSVHATAGVPRIS